MIAPVGGDAPGQRGMMGAGGPAQGMRSPARTVVDRGSGGVRTNDDGFVQFNVGARSSSRFVTIQPSVEPETPLKTESERMRGGNVDVRA